MNVELQETQFQASAKIRESNIIQLYSVSASNYLQTIFRTTLRKRKWFSAVRRIILITMFRQILNLQRSEVYKLLLIFNLTHFFMYLFIYFISLYVTSITVLIIRRSNCINTSSGMISLCKWLLAMPVLTGIPSSHLHRLIIIDDVLIQFDLLMMSIVML